MKAVLKIAIIMCYCRFVDGDVTNTSAQQLIWKQATIFGVGLVTKPSSSDPSMNITYVVAKFDSCVDPANASQNVGQKEG